VEEILASLSKRLAGLGGQAWREALSGAIERAPAASMAAAGFERLLESGGAERLLNWPRGELDNLAAILGSSPVLTRYLVGHDAQWGAAALAYLDGNPDAAELAAGATLSAQADPDALAAALRCMAKREMYRIGARDLLGLATLEETLTAITRLADVAISIAVTPLRGCLVRERGEVLASDGAPVGFVVVGLGKLGGADLNYSSDVDLLYLYDTDQVASGSAEARPFFFTTRGSRDLGHRRPDPRRLCVSRRSWAAS